MLDYVYRVIPCFRKMHSRHFYVCFLVLLTFVSGKRLPTVTVKKCCRLGEMLQDDSLCLPGLGDNWLPKIYAPARKVFLNSEIVPNNWRLQESSPPSCTEPKLVRLTAPYLNYYMLANGSLFVEEHHELYGPEEFCVDKLAALVCSAVEQAEAYVDAGMTMRRKLKIRKCCGEGGAYSSENSTCAIVDGPLGESKGIRVQIEGGPSNVSEVVFVTGFPSCPVGHAGFAITPLQNVENSLDITSDGTLIVDGSNADNARIPAVSYCVERVVTAETRFQIGHLDGDEDGVDIKYATDTGSSQRPEAMPSPQPRYSSDRPQIRLHAFSCLAHSSNNPSNDSSEDSTSSAGDLRYTLYPLALVLSVAFLLATLAVGFLLPGSHHALHWRCQTHYVACLMIGDAMLAASQLMGAGMDKTACVTIAILMHFFFLAAFFWLNTMCFNIWWTFRDFRPSSLEKAQESCRLRVYEAYAWGGPLLIAGCAALLDNLPDIDTTARRVLRPRFGEKRCWFYGDMEILTYFYGPVGLLLLVNLLLFTSTARQLTCGLWKREEVKSTTERAALGRVCMKLVIVMGVTWTADVISWAAGGPHYVWYLTDLINAMQGVFIFIVVGCQPQVWLALKRLYSEHCGRTGNNTGAPQHSSSSQGLPSLGDSVTHNTTANNTMTTKLPMETVC